MADLGKSGQLLSGVSDLAVLLGGQSQSGSGSSVQRGTSSESAKQITEQRNNNTQQSSGASQTLSPETQAFLSLIMGSLVGTSQQYSKDQAIADTEGLKSGVLRDLRETLLPQIAAGEVAAGGYNSTSRALLNNDAINRASDSLTQLTMDAVNNYGNQQQGFLSQIAGLAQILKGANVTTSTSESQSGSDLSVSTAENDASTYGTTEQSSKIKKPGVIDGIVKLGKKIF